MGKFSKPISEEFKTKEIAAANTSLTAIKQFHENIKEATIQELISNSSISRAELEIKSNSNFKPIKKNNREENNKLTIGKLKAAYTKKISELKTRSSRKIQTIKYPKI